MKPNPVDPDDSLSQFLRKNRATSQLKRRSLRGGILSIASGGVNSFVQIASTLLLARVLVPEDFGLVAMVTVIVSFAPVLIDLGTRDAVIQKPSVSHEEMSALFWIITAVGLGCTILLASSGPFLADFYKEPRVARIALLSSLTFVFTALSSQHEALLRRSMMFREIAVVETVANIAASVLALVLALFGTGFWALVVRPVLLSGLRVVGLWLVCGWRPGVPRLTAGVYEMLRFGLMLSGWCLLDFITRSADRIAIGASLGAVALGYYQNAFLVYDNSLNLLAVAFHGVAVASLSKVRGAGGDLPKSWTAALSTITFFSMPAFALLAVIGSDLVSVLLGPKWLPAGTLLTVLALRGIPHVVERAIGSLHVALGRADRWVWWGLLTTVAHLAALFIGLSFGTMGVVVAYVVSMYALLVVAFQFSERLLAVSAWVQFKSIGPQLTSAIVCTGVGFALKHSILEGTPPFARMLVIVPSCLGVYLVLMIAVFKAGQPLQLLRSSAMDSPVSRIPLLGRLFVSDPPI